MGWNSTVKNCEMMYSMADQLSFRFWVHKVAILFLLCQTITCMLQSELEIEPRYPLFGGWKATFVIGYGLPLQDFLFESPDGRRYLNFSFGCPLADTVVDKLTIKVRISHPYWKYLILCILLHHCYCLKHWKDKLWELLCFRLCCQRDQKTHLLLLRFQ